MKRILMAVILVMALVLAAPVCAEEENRQIYVNSDMNMILYIDQPTLQYANQGNILLTKEIIYQDSSKLVPGGAMMVFYALGDVNVLANEAASSYDEVLAVVKKHATPVLAFTMTHNAQVQIPIELTFMESRPLQDGENIYRLHIITQASYNMLDEATQNAADTALHCFADLSTSIEIAALSPGQALGMFNTTDIYGNPRDAQIFAGHRLTMVNVWATYCAPCLEEMPALAEIAAQYRDKGVQMVGIISDVREGSTQDDPMVILASDILEKTGASNYTHLIPDSVMIINKLKDLTAVPTTLFIDQNGKQVGELYIGAHSKDEWVRIIEDSLSKIN